MVDRAVFGVAAFLLLASSALAEDCPTSGYEEIEKLLADAPSCNRSMALFEACSFGASGDVGLGEVVTKKCEGVFLSTLSKSERRTYDRKIEACWHKYAKKEGTMYRSAAAFCAAGVAQDYARRATAKK